MNCWYLLLLYNNIPILLTTILNFHLVWLKQNDCYNMFTHWCLYLAFDLIWWILHIQYMVGFKLVIEAFRDTGLCEVPDVVKSHQGSTLLFCPGKRFSCYNVQSHIPLLSSISVFFYSSSLLEHISNKTNSHHTVK